LTGLPTRRSFPLFARLATQGNRWTPDLRGGFRIIFSGSADNKTSTTLPTPDFITVMPPRRVNPYWLVFAAFSAFFVTAHFAFPELWEWTLGPLHRDSQRYYPFLDMHGRLAAYEAWLRGFDVWSHPNPLDPLGRTNIKPSWGLAISALGMTRESLIFAGTVVVIAAVFVTITIIRPTTAREAVVAFLIACSPGVMLGFERANDDLVYFSLLALVPVALKGRPQGGRAWLAWLIVFLLAPAKYYPGAAFAVFLLRPGSRKQFWGLLGAGVAFIALYMAFFWQEVLHLRSAVPSPNLFFVNGAPIVFRFFHNSLWLVIPIFLAPVATGLFAAWNSRSSETDIALWKQQYFVIGIAVYLFCYFLNSNYDYRFIFLIFTTPLLLEMAFHEKIGRKWALTSRILLTLFVVVLWSDIIAFHLLDLLDARKTGMNWLVVVTVLRNILLSFLVIIYAALAGRLLGPSLVDLVPLPRR